MIEYEALQLTNLYRRRLHTLLKTPDRGGLIDKTADQFWGLCKYDKSERSTMTRKGLDIKILCLLLQV